MAAPPLLVPIHLQNDANNCGEACAQMVIRFLTNDVPVSQDDLSEVSTPSIPPWATSPDELCAMINEHDGDGRVPTYVTHTFASLTGAMNYALAALQNNMPVVPLLKGDSHWVVLEGMTGGAAAGIVFRDPTPARTELPIGASTLDVHAESDECAAYDLVFGDASSAGEFATCQHWPKIFRVAEHAPVLGKFVVVGPNVSVIPATYSCAQADHGGGSPFSRDAVAAAVESGLEEAGLLSQPFWAALVGNRRGDVSSQSRLIHADAASGVSDYYLCPLFDGNGRPRAAAMVSAVSGRLLRGRVLPEPYLRDLFFDPSVPPDTSDKVRWLWGFYRETFESPFFPLVETLHQDAPRFYRPLGRRVIDKQLTRTI